MAKNRNCYMFILFGCVHLVKRKDRNSLLISNLYNKKKTNFYVLHDDYLKRAKLALVIEILQHQTFSLRNVSDR